jgi:hypothetical protein
MQVNEVWNILKLGGSNSFDFVGSTVRVSNEKS